jgi:hypothetical protein
MDKMTRVLLEAIGIFIGIPLALVGIGMLIGYWWWG